MKEASIFEVSENLVKMIAKDWMLVSAGDEEKWNTMTASWGGVGFVWQLPVACALIRPQRFTLEFIEKNETYSLCFFGEEYRKMLNTAGSKSGRDIDKMTELGLTPVFENGTVWFKEAKTVLLCRKKYVSSLNADCFLDKNIISSSYPGNDFHRIFIGEIEKIYVEDNI